uniref:hypothetical protein n=1 Tax=Alicyclobacillus sendaiensis TaxID=192387 RepID=UPI0026F42C5F
LDLVLLVGALWIAAWIGAQSADVALLYTVGFFASTYAAIQVAPWMVMHLTITRPVLAWMAQRAAGAMAVLGPNAAGSTRLMAQPPQWIAVHALDWLASSCAGLAVWFVFVALHRFIQTMLDDEDGAAPTRSARAASILCGLAAGGWAMVQAGPAFAILLNLLGHPQSLDENPLLQLLLHAAQAVPAFRSMV